MNEFISVKIVLDLFKVPKKHVKELVTLLDPITTGRDKRNIYFHYQNNRKWREKYWKILRKLHIVYGQLSGDTFLYCACSFPEKRVPLIIAKSGKLFYIKSFPEKTSEHDRICPFYGESVDTQALWKKWSKKEIKVTLLDFPNESNSNSTEEREERLRPLTNSNKPRLTFTRIMLSYIDDAYGLAFNSVNKGINRLKESKNLSLPTVGKVLTVLGGKLNEKTPKGFRLFVNLISHNSMEISGESLILTYNDRKKIVHKRQIFGWDLWENGFAGSTGKFLNINVVKGKLITRAFFMPLLYLERSRPFIPIESRNEAGKIESLLKQGNRFFKVVTGSISKNYAKLSLPSCATSVLMRLSYYPDLVIFGEPLQVAELMGFRDTRYKKVKERVEKDFCRLRPPGCPMEYIRIG
ncbi:hypothetical protein [Desulfurobacterium sp. TC5-1]|uniref:hypothetical protein n=1 Tax=Desulfurobacterium sp. TC5-1 TaxID=1158318 RepID=UPI0003B4B593|nr:hypothetical protein [Desulfurobacterium sp. TC5-1]